MYNKMMMDIMRSKNPNEALMRFAQSNPKVREVMDMVNRTGDPKSAFYQMAAAKGVDPDVILSMIRK